MPRQFNWHLGRPGVVVLPACEFDQLVEDPGRLGRSGPLAGGRFLLGHGAVLTGKLYRAVDDRAIILDVCLRLQALFSAPASTTPSLGQGVQRLSRGSPVAQAFESEWAFDVILLDKLLHEVEGTKGLPVDALMEVPLVARRGLGLRRLRTS